MSRWYAEETIPDTSGRTGNAQSLMVERCMQCRMSDNCVFGETLFNCPIPVTLYALCLVVDFSAVLGICLLISAVYTVIMDVIMSMFNLQFTAL